MREFVINEWFAVALALAFIYLGYVILKRSSLLTRYCIPFPVIGGLIASLVNLVLYLTGIGYFSFGTSLQTLFLTVFFCSVGFSASLKFLKTGESQVLTLVLIAIAIILLQNGLGCTLATLFGINPKLGLAMGSIPLIGGYGTSGAFGPLLEETFHVENATTVAFASATFGLIAGSLIGGPVAKRLIEKHQLKTHQELPHDNSAENRAKEAPSGNLLEALFLLAVCTGAGTLVNAFFVKIGLTVPVYIGAMVVACALRNTCDLCHHAVPTVKLNTIGAWALNLFLAMAMMGMKIWQLENLAIPMMSILLLQVLLMGFVAYFIVFHFMGRDYEAACFAAGTCGFGLGATPNAIANIEAVNSVYGVSPRALFVVPIVGSLFIDFFNAFFIIGLLNLF